jgi:hypothetical protein
VFHATGLVASVGVEIVGVIARGDGGAAGVAAVVGWLSAGLRSIRVKKDRRGEEKNREMK